VAIRTNGDCSTGYFSEQSRAAHSQRIVVSAKPQLRSDENQGGSDGRGNLVVTNQFNRKRPAGTR
jgi:hypothetical protein